MILFSCIDDMNHKEIDVSITNIDLFQKTEITFKQLFHLHNNTIGKDTIVTGYVVSSDKDGNFFKEIFIQNTFESTNLDLENPRMGIKVRIGLKNSNTQYTKGRRVVLNLEGLKKSTSNEALTLGKPNNFLIKDILEFDLNKHLIKTDEIEELIPKTTALANLNSNDLNTFIKIENLHFKKTEIGMPLAGLSSDDFDGIRTLEFCNHLSKDSLLLETSNFSDFSDEIILNKQVNIGGIYQINFDKKPVLVLNEFQNLEIITDFVECPEINTPNLMISEIADPKVGTGEKARYVEFYNPTNSTVLLNNWNLVRYNKTSSKENRFVIALTGLSINSKEVIIIANNTINKSKNTTWFETYFGFMPQQIHNNLDGNGDDAYELIDPLGVVKDVYGEPNIDGSKLVWDYEDGVSTRKTEIEQPNAVFNSSEWIVKKKLPQLNKKSTISNYTPGVR